MTQTGNNLDVAIQGNGFFEVQMPDGTLAYTRDGSFKTDSQGRVVTSDGYPVQGGFQPVPAGTTAITITASGAATYTTAERQHEFPDPARALHQPRRPGCRGPQSLQGNAPRPARRNWASPAENGFGELQQGSLELSNVSVVQEMVNLILAQRAYEVNSKAVQAADEMMQQSNNLQR